MNDNGFKVCRACGKKIRASDRFCTKCGMECSFESELNKGSEKEEESLICPACGSRLQADFKFCTRCGMDVRGAGKRRDQVSQKPIALENSTGSQNSCEKPHPGGKSPGLTGALIGCVLIVALLLCGICIYSYKDVIFKNRAFRDKAGDPEKIFSGTKAFDITPLDGVRLTAPANALDKKRRFKVSRLGKNELVKMADSPGEESIPCAGFKIDAGMKDDELLPGFVTAELDLRKLEIPEALWGQVHVYRIGSKGDKTEMVSSIHNGALQFKIKKNSVFVTSVLLAVLTGVSYYAYDATVEEKYGSEYAGKSSKYDLDVGYDPTAKDTRAYFRILWPDALEAPHPEEVERVDKALNDIWEKYGWTEANKKEWKMKSPGYYMGKFIGIQDKVFKDKEYQSLIKLAQSDGWKTKNLWPGSVSSVIKSLRYASVYLYKNREFTCPWYRVDIVMKKGWPAGDTALAYERDLALTFPYIECNASKDFYDQNDANITVVHELFHVVQKEYYSYCPDRRKFIWFMEACAQTLEEEANNDYLAFNWNTKKDITIERNAWETFRNPLPDPGDNEKVAQNHGYTLSLFFELLRDNAGFNKNKKEEFVKKVMEAFSGYMASPVSAIYDGCGSTKDELGTEFLDFARGKKEEMRFFVSKRFKNHGDCKTDVSLLDGLGQSLDADNPYYKWQFSEVKPLSAEFRFLSLEKIARHTLKGSYVYVVKGGRDSFKTNNIHHTIHYSSTSSSQWFALEGDYKVIRGDNLKDLSIQRIDSNATTPWFNPTAADLRVLLMLQPEKPEVTLKDTMLRVDIEPGRLKEVLSKESVPVSYTVYIRIPGHDQPFIYPLKKDTQTCKIDVGEDTEPGKAIDERGAGKMEVTYREHVKFDDQEKAISGAESKKAEIKFGSADWSGAWKTTYTEKEYLGVLNPLAEKAPVKVPVTRYRTITITPYNKSGFGHKITWETVVVVDGKNYDHYTRTYLGRVYSGGQKMVLFPCDNNDEVTSATSSLLIRKDISTITDENDYDYTR